MLAEIASLREAYTESIYSSGLGPTFRGLGLGGGLGLGFMTG